MAKKTRNTVGASRAYPNERSKKNKHSDRQEFSIWTRGMRGEIRRDSYAMNVNRRRNVYNYGGFDYLA